MHVTKKANMLTKTGAGPVVQAAKAALHGSDRVGTALKAFAAADRNGDGAVDQKEYLSFGKTGPSKAKLDRFLKADHDGDGRLDRKEFVAACLRGTKACKPGAPAPAPAHEPLVKVMGAPIQKEAPKGGGLFGFLKKWALFPLAPIPVTAYNLVGHKIVDRLLGRS